MCSRQRMERFLDRCGIVAYKEEAAVARRVPLAVDLSPIAPSPQEQTDEIAPLETACSRISPTQALLL
jgi:hypothetical protein